MSIKVHITGEASGIETSVFDLDEPKPSLNEGQTALGVESPFALLGQFKTTRRQEAGTTVLVEPIRGGSILFTDFILSADKTNSGFVILQFSDGTITEEIVRAATIDAPVNIAHAFKGRFRGWRDARLELTTVAAVDASVSIGYLKLSKSLTYSEWDAQR